MTLLGVGTAILMNISTVVRAQEVPEPDSKTGTSEAQIEFVPNKNVPDLINPDDPTTEFPSEEESGENNTGPLSLDYVPNISFGTDKMIKAKQEEYPAVKSDNDFSPFVQVTDNRGTGAGWQLNATFNGFTEIVTNEEGEEIEENSLPGAKIIFSNNEENIVTNGAPEDKKPSSKDSVELSADDSTNTDMIMNAQNDKGMGSWAMVWKDPDTIETPEENESIKLEIPGGIATTGKHKATITWTLSDVPPTEETPTEQE